MKSFEMVSFLKDNGQFVSKIFMGSTFNEIVMYSKKNFKETYIFKPLSSRKDFLKDYVSISSNGNETENKINKIKKLKLISFLRRGRDSNPR